jgi:hypothetical protein
MAEQKPADPQEVEQGFNDSELQDIMSEIESLEREFVEDEAAPVAEAESESPSSDEYFEEEAPEVEPAERVVSIGKSAPAAPVSGHAPHVDFTASGPMNFTMSFQMGEAEVGLNVDRESGLTLVMDQVEFHVGAEGCVVHMPGGAKFTLPFSTAGSSRKAS